MHVLARLTLYVLATAPLAAAVAAGCSDSEQTGSSNTTQSSGTATGGSGTAAGGAGTTTGSGAGGAGSSVGGASSASGAGGLSGASTGTGGGGVIVVATCLGHTYECGDTLDNDNDGLTDWQDPDCLGPCDNTENSFYGGIPGQAGPACLVDCYFDSDSGSGNDGCYWNHKCDEHEMAPDYYPESVNGTACEYDPNANTPGTPSSCDELYMTQAQECYDYCGPLTPNGCDCFGCCELPSNPGNYVWLGSEDASGNGKCTMAGLTDPNLCEPCKPVQACLNPCDICEVCVGKPTLPPECFPDGGTTGSGAGGSGSGSGAGGGSTMQCPPGIQPCGQPGQGPCPSNHYCITGCCQPIPG